MSPKTQQGVSVCIAVAGLGLLIMMIMTEGELGALPLGLVLVGAMGYLGGVARQRSDR